MMSSAVTVPAASLMLNVPLPLKVLLTVVVDAPEYWPTITVVTSSEPLPRLNVPLTVPMRRS